MSTPRLFRFSLQTLLLVTTIAAMGITITLLMREIGPLRSEVKKLREETGQLWIDDETKIHAIRIPGVETWLHRIRLKLPESKNYRFCYAVNEIPANGVPKNNAVVGGRLPSGELICQIRFDQSKDPKSGELQPFGNFDCDWTGEGSVQFGHGLSVGVSEVKNDWIINDDTKTTLFGVLTIGPKTEVFEAESPVVIYSARADRITKVHDRGADNRARSWSAEQDPNPCDGFMLWIEPVK